MKLACSFRD